MQSARDPRRMSGEEIRASVSLASIFGLRMLGLFLILPVFAAYAPTLPGGDNRTLVGTVLGIYGLTQAILQLPYGILADRYGRKRMIVIGLALFAVGSFVAALSTHIWITIIGRAIQGTGAISAAVMALAADLTREEHRTKTMAMIGGSIGLMFALSLVGAPLLYHVVGMGGLFALTGLLSLVAIHVVRNVVPPEPIVHTERAPDLGRGTLLATLKNPELLRLNFGILVLHAVQMAMFVVIPPALVHYGGMPVQSHWKVYLPVVLASFALMLPPLLMAERKGRAKRVFVGSVIALLVVQLGLAALQTHLWAIVTLLLAFFVAFNILEASLPTLVSRVAPVSARATALGVYNTTQAFGLFLGAQTGGVVAQHYGNVAVFAFCAALVALWFAVAKGMVVPAPLAHRTVNVGTSLDLDELRRALLAMRGVKEAIVVAEERVAHLKVAPDWDEAGVMKLLEGRL